MHRFLHYLFGRRYNAVLLISAATAFSWALFLFNHPLGLDAPIFLGFKYFGTSFWIVVAVLVGVVQVLATGPRNLVLKRVGFTVGAFLWAFVAADVWLASTVSTAVLNYSILTLACVFAAVDVAITEMGIPDDYR